jgi:hypothetical protein
MGGNRNGRHAIYSDSGDDSTTLSQPIGWDGPYDRESSGRPSRSMPVPVGRLCAMVGGVMAASSKACRGPGRLTICGPHRRLRCTQSASQPLRRSLVHQFARDREEPGVQASAADAGEPVRCGEMRSGRILGQDVAPVLTAACQRDAAAMAPVTPSEEQGG